MVLSIFEYPCRYDNQNGGNNNQNGGNNWHCCHNPAYASLPVCSTNHVGLSVCPSASGFQSGAAAPGCYWTDTTSCPACEAPPGMAELAVLAAASVSVAEYPCRYDNQNGANNNQNGANNWRCCHNPAYASLPVCTTNHASLSVCSSASGFQSGAAAPGCYWTDTTSCPVCEAPPHAAGCPHTTTTTTTTWSAAPSKVGATSSHVGAASSPSQVGGGRDPHLVLAHGGRADFKGENNTVYNLLSARNVTFNAKFLFDDFVLPRKVVHGSYMAEVFAVIRTWCTACANWDASRQGRRINVQYNASVAVATISELKPEGPKTWTLAAGAQPVRIDNLHVSLHAHGRTLVINNGRWKLTATSKDFPNAPANPGKKLIQIKIDALYDADRDEIAPHGIIGQSYDGDGLALSGKQDDYRNDADEMTTSAQAEGAIEGEASEYKMKTGFSTNFMYSRFDATKAAHRDILHLKDAKSKQQIKQSDSISDSQVLTESTELRDVNSATGSKVATPEAVEVDPAVQSLASSMVSEALKKVSVK